VPSYDSQATANPDRLLKFIYGSSADAEILNPILSADTSSSEINDKVFDGLIDLDENFNLRPRLATSWDIFEEAYLVVNPHPIGQRKARNASQLQEFLLKSLTANTAWSGNIQSVEILPGSSKEVHDTISIPVKGQNGRPKLQALPYIMQQPVRLKFTLKRIDQDFFKPIRQLLGDEYFQSFPYTQFLRSEKPADAQTLLSHHDKILQIAEHNPVIVFHLRQGVQFHDGQKFDSGDVLFTYDSIMNPKNASPRTSDFEPIKKAEVRGPYEIKFTYKRLFSPAIFAWGMGILPEHLLNSARLQEEAERRGKDPTDFSIRDSRFNRRPVGTGAFRFDEWRSDEYVRLYRNDKYWEAPPEYKEFVMRIIPETLTREMEFYAGALDNYSVEPHQVARLKNDPKYQNFSSVGMSYSYIGYNTRKPMFADPRVRTALGMAIDIDQIIRYVLYGEGERVTGPYPKNTEWYDQAIKPLPYDPEGALKILNQVGWKKNADGFLEKDGKLFEFNLITNNGNPTRKNIMTIVQNSWKKLGIKCNIQLFEWAVFLKDFVNAQKFDALVLGWSMGVDPDLYQIWHSSQTAPHKLNFVGYESAEVDRLILRIRKEYDKTKQVEMTRKLHGIIARDQPYNFLFVRKATQLLDKKIVIVEPKVDGTEQHVKIYPTRDGNIRHYFNKWRKLATIPQFDVGG
jgi:ABC-type transport system substrate-binding protein